LGKDIGQIPFHDEITHTSLPSQVNESKFEPYDSHTKHSSSSPNEEIIYERTDNTEPKMDETCGEKTHTCPVSNNDEMSVCDNREHSYGVDSDQGDSNLNSNFSVPRYPHLADVNTRIQSFSTFNHQANYPKIGSNFSIANKANEFAEAGLFYRGFRDRTSCYYCGIGLQNWTSVDNIIERHFLSSRNCPIAKALIQEASTNNRTSMGK
jgi:hypothetical protein